MRFLVPSGSAGSAVAGRGEVGREEQPPRMSGAPALRRANLIDEQLRLLLQ